MANGRKLNDNGFVSELLHYKHTDEAQALQHFKRCQIWYVCTGKSVLCNQKQAAITQTVFFYTASFTIQLQRLTCNCSTLSCDWLHFITISPSSLVFQASSSCLLLVMRSLRVSPAFNFSPKVYFLVWTPLNKQTLIHIGQPGPRRALCDRHLRALPKFNFQRFASLTDAVGMTAISINNFTGWPSISFYWPCLGQCCFVSDNRIINTLDSFSKTIFINSLK